MKLLVIDIQKGITDSRLYNFVDGQNLSHMPDEELTIFRRRNIGFDR